MRRMTLWDGCRWLLDLPQLSLHIQRYSGEGCLTEGKERGSHGARSHRDRDTRVTQLQKPHDGGEALHQLV
jgi:hypothetical protein